jgi:UDP-glucose 4-epimerase
MLQSFKKNHDLNALKNLRFLFFQVMTEFNVKRIVFSSSSTVFGDPTYLPVYNLMKQLNIETDPCSNNK